MNKYSKVLFLPTNVASLREFHEISLVLNKTGIDSIFVLVPNLSSFKETVLKDKKCYVFNNLTFKEKLHKKLFSRLSKNPEVSSKVFLLNRAFKWIRPLLQKENIRIISLVADRHFISGLEPALIKASKSLNLKIVIPPHGMEMDKTSLFITRDNASHYVENFKYYSPSELESCVHPQSGKQISFFNESTLLALKKFGLRYRNPWTPGGSYADLVMVESQNQKARFEVEECPSEKIVITGLLTNENALKLLGDKEKIRKKVVEKYRLDQKKKIVGVALPQLKEHGYASNDEHNKEMNFLCEKLKSTELEVLVSLHPRMNRKDYESLLVRHNLKLLEERIDDVLPSFDFLIATYSSVVNRAIICSIPSLVIDFYGLNLSYLDNIEGVSVIKNREKFSEMLGFLAVDQSYNEQRLKMLIQREKFTPVDGQTEKRISDVYHYLLSH